ncbi:hypothetical protein BRETT_004490 [Brettanomyces bruxellensis]|uniref:Dolichyl-phosphate-mannose--protein mannosyltransferase n=1 Tax=Dekkera bruxellensis TaxID=5007 RepID=A0A871R0Y8_DEKBR|nr:uncharacterized protein BRETT_004490 [Brettanomyces bruxellensis]QOU19269.1 hypothetical protein BRETT_004490 [Brettanomyces bruxellensis]
MSEENAEFIGEKGPQRRYVSEQHSFRLTQISTSQKIQLLILTILALITREWKIDEPSTVVFDELVVGNSVNSYISHKITSDINPPAGKIIYAWIASLFNYTIPKLGFRPNASYVNADGNLLFPYTLLRTFSAVCGSSLVIFMYKTLRSSGVRHSIALFGGFLVLFENSIVVQSRFFFLDAPFLAAIAFAISSIKSGDSMRTFSRKWLACLFLSAISLGYTISLKTSGFFVLVWAFAVTIKQIWYMIGDLKVKKCSIWRFTVLKFMLYLVIPASIYIYFFFVHINLLTERGPAYEELSPEYQRSLINNHLEHVYKDVFYGSSITLRHYTTGNYLHSYDAKYKNGHQQVTLVEQFEDPLNRWFLEEAGTNPSTDLLERNISIPSWGRVRLYHNGTEKHLRVDPDAKPPLSEQDYNREVTALGNNTWLGDDYTDLEVRIAPDYCKTNASKGRVQAIDTVFQLYSHRKGCFLLGTSKKLPEAWGHGQSEVLCIESPKFERSLWYIDSNEHPLFDETTPTVEFKKLSFWDKFVELNKLLFRTLASNKFDHPFMSKPKDWVMLNSGIPYYSEDNKFVYLFGNVITYHLVVLCVFCYALWQICRLILWNPHKELRFSERTYKYEFHGLDYFLGYVINLIPYVLLDQTFFLFCYLPALYFGILLVGQTFELIVSKRPSIGYLFTCLWAIAVFLTFVKFSPLIFGLKWNKENCMSLLLFSTWDNFCAAYKDE